MCVTDGLIQTDRQTDRQTDSQIIERDPSPLSAYNLHASDGTFTPLCSVAVAEFAIAVLASSAIGRILCPFEILPGKTYLIDLT